ncbi:MAG TPA: DUF5916 domain-containing protein [Longimicrobium sp.]|nr:DUF5916 domain-containing protein [Longimicrobium sp.]
MRCNPLFPALIVAATVAAQPSPASAQSQQAASAAPVATARRQGSAVRLAGPAPRLDGVLDDAAWAAAPVLSDYVQRAPNPGAPGTLRTEARVLYDDQAVYVAVRAIDPHPDSIVAPVGRRDMAGVSSDWVHVMLDSYNDKRTAFRFSVNAAGVQKDAFHSNDTSEDLGWDAVWESAARIDSAGWVAEYRIPLSQLRFSRGGADGAQTWGLQLTREIARRSEIDDWAVERGDVNGFVSQFGELRGITGLKPGRRLELLPYTSARLTRSPDRPGDPFYSSNQTVGGMGADLKYGLTSNLTLTATINPDFGQVEADPSQVNLTAFETFFGERRPFFTEGSDIFRFDANFPYYVRSGGFRNDQPFYSRRLGRPPQAADPDYEFADRPDATTILGAAKLSGKTAGGWSVGVLDALTGREQTSYVDTEGQRRTATVEPLTNYLVARAIKDFRGGQSAVGGIVTATVRDLDASDARLGVLTRDAVVAGVDGRHRFGAGNYELRAAVLGSNVRGSTAAISRIQLSPGHYFQRPGAGEVDFDPTRTSLSGWLADVKVEKTGGGYTRGGAYLHARSPGLEMNDVGFQRSTDWFLQGMWMGYNHYTPQGPFRRWGANFNAWNGMNFGGQHLSTGINVNGSWTLKNNWGGWWGSDTELPALRTDILRGGPAFTGPAYTHYEAGIESDGRKRVSGDLYADGYNEWSTVGKSWTVGSDVNLRAGARLRLSAGPSFTWGRDPWIFVASPADAAGQVHYVFADIRQRQVSLTTRLTYAFTPKLTLDFYAQPFVAAGEYGGLKEVTDPRAKNFDDRFSHFGTALSLNDGVYSVDRDGNGTADFTFGRPDFNFKALTSNMVLRWEYRPGSALFVVWSSDRENFEPDGRFRPRRDLGRLFDGGRSPGTNVLLVKFNYWFNL